MSRFIPNGVFLRSAPNSRDVTIFVHYADPGLTRSTAVLRPAEHGIGAATAGEQVMISPTASKRSRHLPSATPFGFLEQLGT